MAISALSGWVISAGAVALSGVAGASIALSGVLAPPQPLDPGIGGVIQSTAAHACVDGPVVSELFAGDRVLVVAQSDDADWVAVRNPQRLGELLWVPISVIVLDDGEAAAVSAAPVGGQCASVTIVAESTPVAADPGAVEPPVDDSGGAAPPSAAGAGTRHRGPHDLQRDLAASDRRVRRRVHVPHGIGDHDRRH